METNKYTIGSHVNHGGVAYEVIDFRDDKGKWFYDLEERNGDGLMDNVPEDELTDEDLEAPTPTFAQAEWRARHVLCGDREGTFTCHTVDRYVDDLVKAHTEEVAALRAETFGLRATLRGLRKIVSGVPCESLNTPWVARGRCIYPSDKELADYGDLIASFEDIDGTVPVETVCAVNAFMEVKKHLDRFFRDAADDEDGKEAQDGPQG